MHILACRMCKLHNVTVEFQKRLEEAQEVPNYHSKAFENTSMALEKHEVDITTLGAI